MTWHWKYTSSGCSGGSLGWVSDSWFWLQSQPRGCGIQPHAGLRAQHAVSLGLLLSLSLCGTYSLSLPKINKSFKKKCKIGSCNLESHNIFTGPMLLGVFDHKHLVTLSLGSRGDQTTKTKNRVSTECQGGSVCSSWWWVFSVHKREYSSPCSAPVVHVEQFFTYVTHIH